MLLHVFGHGITNIILPIVLLLKAFKVPWVCLGTTEATTFKYISHFGHLLYFSHLPHKAWVPVLLHFGAVGERLLIRGMGQAFAVIWDMWFDLENEIAWPWAVERGLCFTCYKFAASCKAESVNLVLLSVLIDSSFADILTGSYDMKHMFDGLTDMLSKLWFAYIIFQCWTRKLLCGFDLVLRW